MGQGSIQATSRDGFKTGSRGEVFFPRQGNVRNEQRMILGLSCDWDSLYSKRRPSSLHPSLTPSDSKLCPVTQREHSSAGKRKIMDTNSWPSASILLTKEVVPCI